MPKKDQLHAVLAVISDLEGTAKKVQKECIVTFTKRTAHFKGVHKTLTMSAEDRQEEAAGLEERAALVETVPSKLKYVAKHIVKWLDGCLDVEKTNQIATADLIVGGVTLGEALPATFLLGLEAKLKAFRAVVESVPTLDPSIAWEEAPDQGKNVYRATYAVKHQRVEKQRQHKVLVPATDHHPAQVEQWMDNVVVGTFSTQHWSGMITPGRKSTLIKRVDAIIQSTKKARMRANSTECVHSTIGKNILDYVLNEE